ncbi:DUF4349 domain-containing protein [Chitinophaga niabensis]|uniref:DUF4349 domain-containing protein n=1 Tax=Chitinophaga niabensis TaxID=536979 RepID=A0A1N6DU79_9BACT|nr:DUF4349 domain-containing protein [Chitinophaga niabensis]SIN74358.1 protein of unknown function [Chitinophaga niabensis]
MRSSSIYWVAIPMLTLFACEQARYNEAKDEIAAAADTTNLLSPSRKRIKTADIHCRVQDVTAATIKLEKLVTSVDGIVVESVLRNDAQEQHEYSYSADSIKQVQLYTPVSTLTLRVPVAHLDSVFNIITAMAGYIDQRTLRDSDVTLQYLSNELKNDAAVQDERETTHTKKDSELEVRKYNEQKKTAFIEREIANMAIVEDVAYSTINVQLFQPQVADVQIVLNPASITRAGFGTETATAFRTGVNVTRSIFIFFFQLWPLWIIAILLWFGYKRLLFKRA